MTADDTSRPTDALAPLHCWRALVLLAIGFAGTIVFFLIVVYIYNYFFLGNGKLTGEVAMAIADSPSAIAFQTLAICLAYAFTLIVVLMRYRLPVGDTLALRTVSPLATALMVGGATGANILIDQSLFWLFDGPLRGLLPQNITYSFNLAAILGNLEQINVVSFVLLVLLSVFVLPLLEELLFRGLIFGALRAGYGFAVAGLISAVSFSIFKLDAVIGLSSFAISLLYARIVEKTGSVWPCILSRAAGCVLTFELSRRGYAYGVGGISYPASFLVSSSLAVIVGVIATERVRRAPRTTAIPTLPEIPL